jgi:SAM-dependent methyltransferase
MFNKFRYRSTEKELIDEPNVDRNLLFKNLRELDILNRTNGGHRISLKGIKQLITDTKRNYHIVDLGCGSGDFLKEIAKWARSNNFNVKLTGVDMNANAIQYLKNNCIKYPEISGITADYSDFLNRNEAIDIVHSSLFCHHLNDNQLLQLFNYYRKHLKIGFVINDLRRNWFAYYVAWVSTRLLNGTALSKNDGPVSVLRGFKTKELIYLLHKAKIRDFSIHKKWAFRYLIVGYTQNYESVEG